MTAYDRCYLLYLRKKHPTVVPSKSESDDMFCLQSYHRLVIHKSLVYKQDRINTQVNLSIRASSSGVYKLMFDLAIVNKILRHCHSWLAGQYFELFLFI